MEESEYDEQKKVLIKSHERDLFELSKRIESHERDLFELSKRFAISKATAKIGDIISDGRITIKIDGGRVSSFGRTYPYLIWEGVEYTKKMIPRKDGSRGCIEDRRIHDRFV